MKDYYVRATIDHIGTSFLMECTEAEAIEFLREKESLIKAAMELAAEEYIEDIFGSWREDKKEALHDEYYDRKLHAKIEDAA